MQRNQQEEIRKASCEELERLIERHCGTLIESSVREADDHVMKQHCLSYRDFGAVVAECGMCNKSLGDAEKKENTEKLDGLGKRKRTRSPDGGRRNEDEGKSACGEASSICEGDNQVGEQQWPRDRADHRDVYGVRE